MHQESALGLGQQRQTLEFALIDAQGLMTRRRGPVDRAEGFIEDLLFVDRDLAYELLWNWVRTLSRRLRASNDKMTFLATTSKF